MEASGHARWFERLVGDCSLSLDRRSAEIQSKRARKQKTDRQDAAYFETYLKDDFPPIWVPSWANPQTVLEWVTDTNWITARSPRLIFRARYLHLLGQITPRVTSWESALTLPGPDTLFC